MEASLFIKLLIKVSLQSIISANLTLSNGISTLTILLRLNILTEVDSVRHKKDENTADKIFDIWGRQVFSPLKGVLYIRADKKVLFY